MDINIDDMKKELKNDFATLLSNIDFKHYSPNSPEFRNAVLTGIMSFLLCNNTEAPEVKDEVKEEMEGAEKYYQRYKATNDAMFKQMSQDELRHADYVLRQKMLSATEEEKAKLNRYGEWIKNFMTKLK